MPKVSILLPTLNSKSYLQERMRSILGQTCSDWEAIILDGYSTDGTREILEEYASRDGRLKIHYSKARGIYHDFNKCIQLANGNFIYFATSDDTMEPSCLEKLILALEENQECDLAHCKLQIIDEAGNSIKNTKWHNFFMVRYFGNLINKKHIRFAPHDGILHYSGYPVYTSLTQLLIKSSLFKKIGGFLTNFGPVADFEWGMRATLLANTVHVPEYLATWRMHLRQASSFDYTHQAKGAGDFIKMADHAMNFALQRNQSLAKLANRSQLTGMLKLEQLYHKIHLTSSIFTKILTLYKEMISNQNTFRQWLRLKHKGEKFFPREVLLTTLRKLMNELNLDKNIKIIE